MPALRRIYTAGHRGVSVVRYIGSIQPGQGSGGASQISASIGARGRHQEMHRLWRAAGRWRAVLHGLRHARGLATS